MLPVPLQLFLQFDLKQNNIIEFGEFVRSLSVFHPKAPLEEKAECAHEWLSLPRASSRCPCPAITLSSDLLLAGTRPGTKAPRIMTRR